RFWYMRGYYGEGRRWLEAVLNQPANQARRAERGRAVNGLGVIATYQGDYAYAQSRLLESLAVRQEVGDKAEIADALNNLGIVSFAQGDLNAARTYHESGLALKRELGDKAGISNSLGNLALIA